MFKVIVGILICVLAATFVVASDYRLTVAPAGLLTIGLWLILSDGSKEKPEPEPRFEPKVYVGMPPAYRP